MSPSSELEKMKDRNLKLAKAFKDRQHQKGGNAKQTNQKLSKKNTPNQKNDANYAWKKSAPP